MSYLDPQIRFILMGALLGLATIGTLVLRLM
jgi:hypothetical protein